MMMPICVGNASGQAISFTTPMESPPPPASKRRRYDADAAYAAEGPPLRYSRSATAPHMIMYDAYIASEMVMAASVPHGMLVAGVFSELARFAPDKMPVKHGKKTESTSENVTPSEYPGPQLSRSVLVDNPVTADDAPGRGAAIRPA